MSNEPWEVGVYSSMVQAVGYNPERTELLVTWTNGKKSAYSGVPEAMAIELSKAPSVGTMINTEIKNVYPQRYV